MVHVLDESGAKVAGFRLDSPVSHEDHRLVFIRHRSFEALTPDGVLVVFDGSSERIKKGEITVVPRDEAECNPPLDTGLEWVGCWEVEVTGLDFSSDDGSSWSRRYARDEPAKPPGFKLFFPAPWRAPVDALVLDLGGRWYDKVGPHQRRLLRGLGRIAERGGTRYLSFDEEFRMEGCENAAPGSAISPTAIYGKGVEGTHMVFLDRAELLAVAAASIEHRGHGIAFDSASFDSLAIETGSLDGTDFEYSTSGIENLPPALKRCRQFRLELVVLPVTPELPFTIAVEDSTTGSVMLEVALPGVPRTPGVVHYVGDLNELSKRRQR